MIFDVAFDFGRNKVTTWCPLYTRLHGSSAQVLGSVECNGEKASILLDLGQRLGGKQLLLGELGLF